MAKKQLPLEYLISNINFSALRPSIRINQDQLLQQDLKKQHREETNQLLKRAQFHGEFTAKMRTGPRLGKMVGFDSRDA